LVGDVGVSGNVFGVLLVRLELASAGEAGTLGELLLLARWGGRGEVQEGKEGKEVGQSKLLRNEAMRGASMGAEATEEVEGAARRRRSRNEKGRRRTMRRKNVAVRHAQHPSPSGQNRDPVPGSASLEKIAVSLTVCRVRSNRIKGRGEKEKRKIDVRLPA
jgi:hypothetical protein